MKRLASVGLMESFDLKYVFRDTGSYFKPFE